MPRMRKLTPGASPLHFFGSEVRRARTAAGMTLADLAVMVPCDQSTVSRIESGLLAPDLRFAQACDEAFPNADGWFTRFYSESQEWGEAFPREFRSFAQDEAEATALYVFEHAFVPGLLQTEDYARAVLSRHPVTSDDQVAERVKARLARQAVLDRAEPPLLWSVIDESALRRMAGTTEVMRGQLAHYLEDAADGRIIEDAATVGRLAVRFRHLQIEAMTPVASIEIIEQIARER